MPTTSKKISTTSQTRAQKRKRKRHVPLNKDRDGFAVPDPMPPNNKKQRVDSASQNEDPLEIVDCWRVFEAYIGSVGMVQHHIDSYNTVFRSRLQKIVNDQPDYTVIADRQQGITKKHTLCYKQLHFTRPNVREADGTITKLMPLQARLRGLTYATTIHLDLELREETWQSATESTNDVDVQNVNKNDSRLISVKTKSMDKVFLGKIPTMLRSDLCWLAEMNTEELVKAGEDSCEMGGYFIVNGSEKVIVAQEKLAENQIYVHASSNIVDWFDYKAEIRSMNAHVTRSSASAVYVAVARKDRKLYVNIPQVNRKIPLYLLFCALGITRCQDIETFLYAGGPGAEQDPEYAEALERTLEDRLMIQDQSIALDFIGQRATIPANTVDKRVNATRILLARELLPHVGGKTAAIKKAAWLGLLARKAVLCTLGRINVTDRDNYSVKRAELAGSLLESLFKQIFQKMTMALSKQMKKNVDRDTPILLASAVKSQMLTKKMGSSFSTGNWGLNLPGQVASRTGVTQQLERQSRVATLSHCRRVDQQLARDGKLAGPRMLHSTQFGVCCPAETPEGRACGLVKNFSVCAMVTRGSQDAAHICEHLFSQLGVTPMIAWTTTESESDGQNKAPVVTLGATKVFVNSQWIGSTDEPYFVVTRLRALRRSMQIVHHQTSITHIQVDDEIHIDCDDGRVIRPLFVVDSQTNELKLTKENLETAIVECGLQNIDRWGKLEEDKMHALWHFLLHNGYVEFIDVREAQNTQIAMTCEDLQKRKHRVNYTHCEVHPASMMGIAASLIPFADHNQSPRNTYNSAMCKQGMAVPMENFKERMDSFSYQLHYPQQPLVQTRVGRMVQFDQLPSGCMCIVAFLCRPGENEEDAIVMNKSSIDRGLFRSTTYKTYMDRERLESVRSRKTKPSNAAVSGTTVTKSDEASDKELADPNVVLIGNNVKMYKRERFCLPVPEQCAGADFNNYAALDTDGLAQPGASVESRDVLIGKTAHLPTSKISSNAKSDANAKDKTVFQNAGSITSTLIERDCSKTLRTNESTSVVDTVMLTEAPDGSRMAKVRTRSHKIPQIGDKFSSMHGQKGTVGSILRQEDMPWSQSGMSPDILINSHALPTRMTVGMILEMLLGKCAASLGTIADGTCFSKLDIDEIQDIMKNCGMEPCGNEVMYSGATGEPLEAKVFMGPTFYQRLKHLSAEKVHARAHGPISRVTRQPVEGRGKDGGFRFGEMERDCGVAHGAAEFVRDRLHFCSDNYVTPMCKRCGLVAIDNLITGNMWCQRCNSGNEVVNVEVPYAHKLMTYKMASIGIAARTVVK